MTFFTAFLLTLLLDQISKAVVRVFLPPGNSLQVLGNFLVLRQVRNPGVVFGLFSRNNLALMLVFTALLVILALLFFLRGIERPRYADLAMALVCGGAVGNIIDRVVFGRVIDFIDFNFWPVFNLADIAIVVGVGLLVLYFIRYYWREGKLEKGQKNAS